MRRAIFQLASLLGAAAFVLTAAPARAATDQNANGGQATQTQPKHHSKLKGAAVGGAGGAVVGGKKGAAVGAVGGAAVQHHKNKKEEKQMKKSQ